MITICLLSGSVVLLAVLSIMDTRAIGFPFFSSEQNSQSYLQDYDEGFYSPSLAGLAGISAILLVDRSAKTLKSSTFTALQLPPPKVI
jgi:hypothetical protein